MEMLVFSVADFQPRLQGLSFFLVLNLVHRVLCTFKMALKEDPGKQQVTCLQI